MYCNHAPPVGYRTFGVTGFDYLVQYPFVEGFHSRLIGLVGDCKVIKFHPLSLYLFNRTTYDMNHAASHGALSSEVIQILMYILDNRDHISLKIPVWPFLSRRITGIAATFRVFSVILW